MKIAYFLDDTKQIGGSGNLLLQQAKLMSDIHETIVVLPLNKHGDYNREYARRCRSYAIPCVCIRYGTAFSFADIDYSESMKSVAVIEEFARSECIDFFHSVQLNTAVEYVSRKLKIPHLMNIYQLDESEFKTCPADIYAGFHMCDSQMYSALWGRMPGLESRCVRPVALCENIVRKSGYAKDKIKILMLGIVCERKNQMAAIHAIEKYCGSSMPELHIAGDIWLPYAEKCISYVREHGLEKNIVFHGFVSDIRPVLEECDCLLCSSKDESFPSSMVEALSYDLTIISTPVAGVPELFRDKENSFISRDYSAESIGQSIAECMEYHANGKIREIHENAADTWETCFDRNLVRRQIDSYYQYILSTGQFKSLHAFLKIADYVEPVEKLLKDVNADGEEWIYNRGLYYMFLRDKMPEGEIYIWGAGKLGKLTYRILEKVFPDLKVMAFIDTYKEGSYCGVPVMRLRDMPIRKDAYYCISFAEDREAAFRYLRDKGLACSTQVWYMP